MEQHNISDLPSKVLDKSEHEHAFGAATLQSKDSLSIIRDQNSQNNATGCKLPILDIGLPEAACTVAKAELAGALTGGVPGGVLGGVGGYAMQSFGKAFLPRVFTAGVGEMTASMAAQGLLRGGVYGAMVAGVGVLGYEVLKQSAEHPDWAPDPRYLI